MRRHGAGGSRAAEKTLPDVLTKWVPTKKERWFGLSIALGFVVGDLMVVALCLLGLVIGEGKPK